MFRPIPFTEEEMIIRGESPSFMGPPMKVRNTPVSPRENMSALYYEKKPFWIPMPGELKRLIPQLYNDNLGRGGAEDTTDVFGLVWEYVEVTGGSIVHPGRPLLDDANNWRGVIHLPDIDSWDWAAEAAKDRGDLMYPIEMSFINGFWFERLISFMDFIPAAMALIDDEQVDAVKDLFAAMTDLGCRLVDKFCEYFPAIDSFNVHDDWGAQKAPFFSQDVAYELFVPFMKQITDHIHSKGRIATLHSCGHNEDRIQCYIDGGFDQWQPQTMNDIHSLYENYGDKIVFSVWPDEFDFENSTEEEQREAARRFVETYTQPGKPVLFNEGPMRGRITQAFTDEVYRHSRKIYAERG